MTSRSTMSAAWAAAGSMLVSICLALAADNPPPKQPSSKLDSPDPPNLAPGLHSPRDTVRRFLQDTKQGRLRDAFALTTSSPTTAWGVDFPKRSNGDPIRTLHQSGTGRHAVVMSNPFQGQSGPQVFYAVLENRDGQWLLSQSGCAKPEEAAWMMKGYQSNPTVRVDALRDELIGEWWAVCDSTIVVKPDGTGHELSVGPGGPVPGQQPEPFDWRVSGNELQRRFADRQETLELIWVDDDSVRFRPTTGSGWTHWERRNPKPEHP